MDGLLSTNYFAVGEELVKRLAELPDIKAVLSARDIEAVQDNQVPTPSVMVLFAGEAPTDTSFASDAQLVAQRWLLEVVISNHSGSADGELAEAGYLIARVIEKLQGWTPAGAIEPFRRIAAPAPSYPGKVSLYPLVFETLVLT